MTTIYVVNSGEYSDYGIDGVFSTREKAEQYMQAFKKEGYGGYNDIDEMELDQWLSEIDKGLLLYQVMMYRSGNVYRIERSNHPAWATDKVHWMTHGYWNPPEPWANFYVWAKDEQCAVKVANERRIQDLATTAVG